LAKLVGLGHEGLGLLEKLVGLPDALHNRKFVETGEFVRGLGYVEIGGFDLAQ
jgi:hypothetical protein